MEAVKTILENIPLPAMYRIRNTIEGPSIRDVPQAVRMELKHPLIAERIRPGQTVAITVGSRGVSNQPLVVKTLVEELQRAGAQPFIIPAMGSHAGADAAGQKYMLEGLGFTEEYIGAPIKAGMDVVQIGTTDSGMPVYIDKFAHEADAIVLVNRVKVHTAFSGEIESGLVKMSVIGLGKQKGAEICHELGFEDMEARIREISRLTLKKLPVLFGLALIENGRHETAEIHAVPAEEIEAREIELLKRAKELLARVPFRELEVLVIDRIGKDISGTGLDPNVVGRYHTGLGSGGPSVRRISVLDITDASHGNGNGLGVADFTTQRAFDKFNLAETYPNSLTSNVPVAVKIPMALPNDRLAIQAAIKTCLVWDKTEARVVRITDTLSLEEFEVSENLLDEVRENPALEVIDGPYSLDFDESGNLF
jgi:Lactate racemase N-terminal domain